MEAMSVLLEPYYEFRLEIPEEMTGRAMTDMEKLFADFTLAERAEGRCVLTGCAPVETMRDYQKEVYAYTRGQGNLTVRLKGLSLIHISLSLWELKWRPMEFFADSESCVRSLLPIW